jgi:hypothetical protein
MKESGVLHMDKCKRKVMWIYTKISKQIENIIEIVSKVEDI